MDSTQAEVSLSRRIVPLPITLPSAPLLSNFYKPSFNPGVSIHVYAMAFTPEIDPGNRSLRKSLVAGVDQALSPLIGFHILSGLNLYALQKHTDPPVLPCLHDKEQYALRLTYVRTVSLAYVQGQKDTHMVLNIVLKRVLRELGLVQVTKLPKYYDRSLTETIKEFGINIWRGYTTELTLRKGVPMISIDFSSKIVHMRSFMDDLQEVRVSCDSDWVNQAKSQFINRIVMTKYGNNRCYRIDDICMNMNPTQTFLRNDVPTSYIKYFKSQYNVDITDSRQPLLKTTIKASQGFRDIYLVPELVSLTGLNDEERGNYDEMRRIADYTKLNPPQRREFITRLITQMMTSKAAAEVLRQSQLVIPQESQVVPGRSLAGEMVNSGNRPIPIGPDGNFQIRDSLAESVELLDWVMLAGPRELADARSFAGDLKQRMVNWGIRCEDPEIVEYDYRTLERVIRQVTSERRLQIVVVAIRKSGEQKKVYERLKHLTTTTYSVATQAVVFRINPKRYQAIVEKIALQIQAKVGAQLWIMRPTQAFGKYLMVVGLDVFHDTVERKKSVLGFCATIHPNLSKYYSTTAMHETGQEIATAVGNLLLEALEAFRERARRYPETVIFFRDGVSESQVEAVREFEVRSVLQACERVRDGESAYTPNLIYTVVIKNTSAVLISQGAPAASRGRGRGGRGGGSTSAPGGLSNPAPGTLVTDEIVPESGDFYLISHYANQGISAPTLYRTIYASRPDGFPLEELARLAYKLCHMYYNWSGAIKVPAPCMMAHKIAFLVGQCVHATVNQAIKPVLFFL